MSLSEQMAAKHGFWGSKVAPEKRLPIDRLTTDRAIAALDEQFELFCKALCESCRRGAPIEYSTEWGMWIHTEGDGWDQCDATTIRALHENGLAEGKEPT